MTGFFHFTAFKNVFWMWKNEKRQTSGAKSFFLRIPQLRINEINPALPTKKKLVILMTGFLFLSRSGLPERDQKFRITLVLIKELSLKL
jgi:hypothetical protein